MNRSILFFDGECIFCDTFIRLIYRLDRKQNILFCALQAERARQELGDTLPRALNTVVFKKNHKIYVKSGAVVRALAEAQPIFSLLSIFLLIPHVIRDSIYDIVAKYRYKIFGKKELCTVDPTLDRSRFIIK